MNTDVLGFSDQHMDSLDFYEAYESSLKKRPYTAYPYYDLSQDLKMDGTEALHFLKNIDYPHFLDYTAISIFIYDMQYRVRLSCFDM